MLAAGPLCAGASASSARGAGAFAAVNPTSAFRCGPPRAEGPGGFSSANRNVDYFGRLLRAPASDQHGSFADVGRDNAEEFTDQVPTSETLGDSRGAIPTTILGGKLGYRKHGAPHAALASLLAARRRPASSPQRRSSGFSCGNQDQNPADGVQTRVCEPPNALSSPL